MEKKLEMRLGFGLVLVLGFGMDSTMEMRLEHELVKWLAQNLDFLLDVSKAQELD